LRCRYCPLNEYLALPLPCLQSKNEIHSSPY
jgi:hypothetical protein